MNREFLVYDHKHIVGTCCIIIKHAPKKAPVHPTVYGFGFATSHSHRIWLLSLLSFGLLPYMSVLDV